jgi:hypothetical protein
MSIEHGGYSGKEVEPISKQETTLSSQSEKQKGLIERMRSLLPRKKEPLSDIERIKLEDPEFFQWLEAIAFRPERMHINSSYIHNPVKASEIRKIELMVTDYIDKASNATDPKIKESFARSAEFKAGNAWHQAAEAYVGELGSGFLENITQQIEEQGDSLPEDREGLSLALMSGLSDDLSVAILEDETEEKRYYNRGTLEHLKKILSEIKGNDPDAHYSPEKTDRYYKGSSFKFGQDGRNYAPFYAILTYERTASSKDLLSFAMHRLESMGGILGGGLIPPYKSSEIKNLHVDFVISGDCLIMAARIAHLLGDGEKQQELYSRAFYHFGESQIPLLPTAHLTAITHSLSERSYPALLRRLIECAQGAGLFKEADALESARRQMYGEEPERIQEIDGDSLTAPEELKALTREDDEDKSES